MEQYIRPKMLTLMTTQAKCGLQLLLVLGLAVTLATAGGSTKTSITTTTTISTCGPQFPTACNCGDEMYEDKMQYVVNCTNAGLNSISVLEYMPSEVQILIFTGNRITELPWNVFGTINDYEQLKIVDMSSNHIREIRGKSYHRVQHVERLILNHNNLSISRNADEVNHHHPRVFSNFVNLKSLHLTDAFDDNTSPQLSADLHDIFMNSQLTQLQKLHLEQNEITQFGDRQVFCSLPALTDLYLGDNRLREINFELMCLKHLRFLDLERNRFAFVKAHDLLTLNEVSMQPERVTPLMVDFGLNPFTCGCDLASFWTWSAITNVSLRNRDHLMCFTDQVAAPILKLNMRKDCNSDVDASLEMFNTYTATAAGARQQHTAARVSGDGGTKGLEAEIETADSTAHTATLIFLLIVLSMILIALLGALVYVSREKLRVMMTPVFDNVAKKVQYTSIKDEDCPEVHV